MDKERFLKARLPEREIDIPGVGTIRVRGLSRAEALVVRDLQSDLAAMERRILSLGIVDPELTDDDVARWYEAAPAGEVDPVVDAIAAMSALGDGAPKSGVPSVRDRR